MLRQIIRIDEDACSGCGLCVSACHEGAIGMVNGKARLLRDDYCDGLGNCLPVCPTGAITFEQREALAYNQEEVNKPMEHPPQMPFSGCPGSQSRAIHRDEPTATATPASVPSAASPETSQLNQWPVQIKLVPVTAPYFDNANLLVAADCAAYAYAGFHRDFMRNKITVIGCPKLDEGDYSEKLTAILQNNAVKSVTVVRMEVPCCGGIEYAVTAALQHSGKMIPWQVVTLSTGGKILE
ncbi:MAG: 4Fe-4S binding protein [Oscillospiraceae bacterium]|nr:4Fe-4S binding protein [Oscillospiraceae bacterium]